MRETEPLCVLRRKQQMKALRKIAVLAAAAAICCSASVLTGCGSTKSNMGEEPIPGTVYSPTVPDNPVAEDAPGEEQTAAIGELVNFQDKLEITLDQVVEIDDVDKTQYRVLCAEFTIKNNSDAAVDCSTLTHFSSKIDGNESKAPVRDVQAAVAARKYYTTINNADMQALNQPIAPGETAKGYVYVFAPTAWQEMQLIYIPYKYYSNDRILFNMDESKFNHYTGDIG